MVKRKNATKERSGDETTAKRRRHTAPVAPVAPVTQDALPGLAPSEPKGSAAHGGRGVTPEVTLYVAPANGAGQPPRARQQSATPELHARPTAAPSRPRISSGKRFGALREALADGWEIVQPIFARPLWSAADDSQTAFNFVLRRDQATRLLTVPGSRTVERFIAAHSFTVDVRH